MVKIFELKKKSPKVVTLSLTTDNLYSILKIIKGDYKLIDVKRNENGTITIDYDTGEE